MPNKILINENAGYSWNIQQYQFVLQEYKNNYGLYFCDSISELHFIKQISRKEYTNLVNEIYKSGYDSLNINLFDIDSIWLKQNIEKNIKKIPYYGEKYSDWSDEQREFVFKEMSNISNYNDALGKIIRLDGSFIIHQETSKVVELSLIYGNDTISLKSNSLGLAYRIPWKFEEENKISYNFGISDALLKILKNEWTYKEPKLTKKELSQIMVKEIFDSKCKDELYKLSINKYSKELQELKGYFTIENAVEYGYRGRYVWNTPQVFKVTLKNDLMKENVFIQYFITKQGNTLYPRDSIINDYRQLVSRVQSIDFLMDFISKDTSWVIDICYFDNKGVNYYNIDGFNKDPEQWIKHDKFLERIKRYENEEPKPTYANEDAIRTSKQLYCGCNYRFEKDFAEKAIFIELNNKKTKDNSVWYLLPDNTVLLYIMQGEKVLDYDYTEFGKSKGLQYPCVLFDLKGNILKKEK